MESSPRGRQIEYVEGSPDEIIERGRAIKALGDDMLDSATTLENIKNNALEYGGQQGKAIEKLRDSIGDSFETLRKAGELYQPVGPVITTYGLALDDIQPLIKSAVDDCDDLWDTYVSLPGQVNPRVGPGNVFGPEPGSPEAEQQAEQDEAKRQALDAWEDRAEDFDRYYDTWEEAFDTAVSGISDELSDAIEDSFWDNFGDVISVLTEILSWAALIVGIVAIFLGGWVILLAVGLAFAAFALTAIKYANGAATGWDLAFAGLAIIPVAKVTNLTKFSHVGNLLMRGTGGVGNAVARGWKAVSKGPIDDLVRNWGKPAQLSSRSTMVENVIGKSYRETRRANLPFYVGNRELFTNSRSFFTAVTRVDWFVGRTAPTIGHYGRLANVLDDSFGVDIKLPGYVDALIG